MKIIQTNDYRRLNQIAFPERAVRVHYANIVPEGSGDTLVKTKTPNFRGVPVNFKDVVNNPKLLQQVMTAIAMGAAALVGAAASEDTANNPDEVSETVNNNIFTEIFNRLFPSTLADENAQLRAVNDQLSKENAALKEKLSSKPVTNTVADSDEEVYAVKFPSKRGSLKKPLRVLKAHVESLKLDKSEKEQLEQICEKIVNENNLVMYGIEKSSEILANELYEKLSNSENVNEVISEYYEGLCNAKDSSTRVRVIDKISLPQDPKKIVAVNKPIHDPVDKKPKYEFKLLDENKQMYLYTMPGTAKNGIKQNLKPMLKFFQKNYLNSNETPVRWMWRESIGSRVTKNEVENEILRYIQTPSSGYKNISEENASEIADILQNDRRFSAFSLHGALRLLDRYLDFNSDISYEDQACEILECLENVIKKAVKDPGIKYQQYIDDKGNVGLRAVIENVDMTQEERKIFGTSPFIICICEEQNRQGYNKYRKIPVIATVFSPTIHQ